VTVQCPADNRLPAALAAKERALRSPRGRAITSLPLGPPRDFLAGQVTTAMNGLYESDPDGLETLAALQREEWARTEQERIEQEERAYHVGYGGAGGDLGL
jgi:hypothetical protein